MKNIKPEYKFLDKWNVSVKKFKSLEEAEKEAKKQMGIVTIYRNREMIKNIEGESYFA